jgi:hypothetical protein
MSAAHRPTSSSFLGSLVVALGRRLARSGPVNRVRDSRPRLSGAIEHLEPRLPFATAGGVENILLPEFMAQMADANGNQLPASDAWWALRSQRNMAIDEPISNVQYLGAHNAYNSLNEGFFFNPVPPFNFLGPNQLLSLTGQLDVGARLLELDIHDPHEFYGLSLERRLVLRHGPFPGSPTRDDPYQLDAGLAEIQAWLTRPDNRNEIIFLDFEDVTEESESNAEDPLLPKLEQFFGSQIYTPAERAVDGAWPSRTELLSRDKRVIIFTHRNDSGDGRFGPPQLYTDPGPIPHLWYGASLAFRADSAGDLVNRGNFEQISTDDFSSATTGLPENADAFFAVQGDCIRNFTARRFNTADVIAAARINVNFTKMDYLFTDDEDAGLGGNFNGQDPAFDIPEDNRVALLESAVWSWAKDDPAVDRQIFMDLIPGDGTGIELLGYMVTRAGLDAIVDLAAIGAAARATSRDVAIQLDGRWVSTRTTAAAFSREFAARSVAPDTFGRYEWRVTTGTSQHWADGYQMVRDEFGSGFEFSAPVNGFQNAQLAAAAGSNAVWMNVHDFDRDGNWQIGGRAPAITNITVEPSTIDEGAPVQLTVSFIDDPEGHSLQIDWGDGSQPTVIEVAAGAQQLAVVPHTFQDDHPQTGTAVDNLAIRVTLVDAAGLADERIAQITVKNVVPVIVTFASDAAFSDTAQEGEPVNISASFADVGVLDTHRAVVDWGDGSAPEVVTVNQGSGSGAVTGSHVYAAGGIYTITLLLTDDDTGAASATTTAVVTGVGLNNGILFVIGDTQRDNVTINHTGNGRLKVHANFIAQSPRSFAVEAVNQIITYLGDGNDHLNISNHLSIPAIVHGGRGNDHLIAGGGPTVLLGDVGDDHLIGQSGRDILIGGTGRDRLIGGTGDDVLIGGNTNQDQDDGALMSAMTTWNSPIAYSLRVFAINALWIINDDEEVDQLTGGAGQDLYDGVGTS